MVRVLSLLLVLTTFSVSVCARELKESPLKQGVEGAYDNPQTWLSAARRHEAEGDLQRELYAYRLARTVSPSDIKIDKHLRRVESEIEARVSDLLTQAERAERHGKTRFARTCYLDVLALQPGHPKALVALRSQDKSHALLAQQNRQRRTGPSMAYVESGRNADRTVRQTGTHTTKRPRPVAKRKGFSENQTDRKQLVARNLSEAETSYQAQRLDEALIYLNLAERAGNGSKRQLAAVDKARKAYAEALYNRGVISYRNEPDKALRYWRYALKFDPQDDKSRLRIDSLNAR